MNKDRLKIYIMFDGRCAYCGDKLKSNFHIDHVNPKYKGGINSKENLYPACPRCNIRKSVFTIEQFRHEISEQVNRLRRNSNQFRLAESFNQIYVTNYPVVFWFEKYNEGNF
jgi:5-methylcytosine-specific restriction endonuclease McrA